MPASGPSTPRRRKPAARSNAAARPGAAPRDDERVELDAVFESVARYFALLSEPTRLRILHTICRSEHSVSEIVAATGATQTNVSRHLSMMHQAGVVARRREGNIVFYKVLDPELTEICRAVSVRIASRIESVEPLRRDLLDYAGTR